MRIVTFNVNGIRARLHQLKALVEKLAPDIIGLQEVKVDDENFPYKTVAGLGLHVETFGQKGHYGVALLSKNPPLKVIRGLPNDPEDPQKRLITAVYNTPSGAPLTVINGYFPQGENRGHPIKFPHKQRFYRALTEWLTQAHNRSEPVMIMGDFNIAPQDIDIGIGEDNAKRWLRTGKCSFLPEEREWFQRLLDWGLVDLYRHIHPNRTDKFSWFDYRSRGFERTPKRGLRIDTILGTSVVAEKTRNADIDYEIRAMTKPSDHAPVWVELNL